MGEIELSVRKTLAEIARHRAIAHNTCGIFVTLPGDLRRRIAENSHFDLVDCRCSLVICNANRIGNGILLERVGILHDKALWQLVQLVIQVVAEVSDFVGANTIWRSKG